MRRLNVLVPAGAILAASAVFVTTIVCSAVTAGAGSREHPNSHQNKTASVEPWPPAKVVIARPRLDLSDEVATLRAIQLALNEVADGSSHVWYRANGRLSGIIKPTMSFRDKKGNVCRHLEIWLTAGTMTKKTESIACRQRDRVWTFEG